MHAQYEKDLSQVTDLVPDLIEEVFGHPWRPPGRSRHTGMRDSDNRYSPTPSTLPDQKKITGLLSAFSTSLEASSLFLDSVVQELTLLRKQTNRQKEEIALLNDQLKEKEEIQESMKIRESELERGFQNCILLIERLELENGNLKGAKEAEKTPLENEIKEAESRIDERR